ncbi:VCBS repeat-containing protein, partial [Candidatus Poribacteria bacterium]|nr:VCBS repeat-containing protein [Candidatus Poribacteria bacterium]
SLFEGVPDRLYRNNGDGTFTDVTAAAGVGGIGGPFRGKGLGVVAADFNNDGHPDLYVANDDTPNNLFYNNGDGTFTDIALTAGCAYSFDGVAQAGMGVDAGDYNGDGLLDLFVSNLSHETNALYRNNGDGTFSDVIYETHIGKESYLYVGFGTGFFDYDNDGHLDLFIANGHVIDNVELTSDVLTYAQRNQMFHNNGDGTFTEVAFDLRERVSRGAIFGDYDNDGDVDLVVTQSNQAAELYRNDGGNQQNWLRIKPVGTISNRDGIGARVTLTVEKQSHIQEVHTGASYLSSNDSRLVFGLGTYTIVDRLEIRWPSGVVQVLENLPVNQELVIEEEKGNADFFKAVRENNIESVRVALKNGANVNAKNALGNTGLMIAAIQGHVAVGRLLVEQGADVNVKNIKGNSALIFSIHATGNVDFARMLIENGADLNARNSDNETALMYAASKGHADILRLLIENGADIYIKNANGLNALKLAISKGDDAIVDMLKSAGAK